MASSVISNVYFTFDKDARFINFKKKNGRNLSSLLDRVKNRKRK